MRKRGFEKITYEQFIKDFSNVTDLVVNYEDVILPVRGTKNSAGYDFFSSFSFVLKEGEKIKIPTGIKAYMMNDEYLAIVSKSGIGTKYNVRLCNQIGIIDADYYNNANNQGHILVMLQNHGNIDWVVNKGDKIVQGIFHKYLTIDEKDTISKERNGGFGSTGEGGS